MKYLLPGIKHFNITRVYSSRFGTASVLIQEEWLYPTPSSIYIYIYIYIYCVLPQKEDTANLRNAVISTVVRVLNMHNGYPKKCTTMLQ